MTTETTRISFVVNTEDIPKLGSYNESELAGVAKHVFMDWYNSTYTHEDESLKDKICQVVRTSLIPPLEEMQNINKELFGISKVSQKKGEIGENGIFELFKSHFQEYALTPTNHLPHHGDAEVVTPSNLKLLLEVKNYQQAVDNKEITKLKFDMKENKIKCALFVSIKSSIIGKKIIDYEKFDDDYFIVFISYVSDATKIHAGLLLLELLANMDVSTSGELKTFEAKIKEGLEEVTQLVDIFTSIKEKFLLMEKSIKNSLDDHYVTLRNQELELKEKINKIWFNVTTETKKIMINAPPKDKHFVVMSRVHDILKANNIHLEEKEENVWHMKKDEAFVGELKKKRVAVDLEWKVPNIELRISNDDKSYNMLETIIKTI